MLHVNRQIHSDHCIGSYRHFHRSFHCNRTIEVCATVTEDAETDEPENDAPDDSFTVPSNITGL